MHSSFVRHRPFPISRFQLFSFFTKPTVTIFSAKHFYHERNLSLKFIISSSGCHRRGQIGIKKTNFKTLILYFHTSGGKTECIGIMSMKLFTNILKFMAHVLRVFDWVRPILQYSKNELIIRKSSSPSPLIF